MQKKSKWFCLGIILLSVIMMLYYGNRKEGYHVDEMYSYGLANSEYLPFMHFGEGGYSVKDWMNEYGAGENLPQLVSNLIKDFGILKENGWHIKESPIYEAYLIAQENSADTKTTTWMSGQAYKDYLGASKSNMFNYASVYYNQRGDVHPPFYYMLLHTISSVFQGTFSKWYGLSINILFLVMTMLLFYTLIEKYMGGYKVALATIAVYGFSQGCLTNAMYIRMYAVLTFFVVFMCYVHIKIREEGFKLRGINRKLLIAATFLGYYTHYYFVLYAMAIAFAFCVWIVYKKQWRTLVSYILTMGITAACGLIIWPFAVKHVFGGYRGQESFGNLANSAAYLIKIKIVLERTVEQILGAHWYIWLILALVLFVFVAIRYKRGNRMLGKFVLIFFPAIIYFCFVAQIVPFFVERYFLCTYPFICLFVILSVWYAVGKLAEGKLFAKSIEGQEGCANNKSVGELSASGARFQLGMTLLAAVLILLENNALMHKPEYLFLGGQETAKVPENTTCLYVLPDGTWNESAIDSYILAQCDRVAVVYEGNMFSLQDTYTYKEGDCVMVVVSKSLNADVVLENAKQVLNVPYLPEKYREDGDAIRIYLSK